MTWWQQRPLTKGFMVHNLSGRRPICDNTDSGSFAQPYGKREAKSIKSLENNSLESTMGQNMQHCNSCYIEFVMGCQATVTCVFTYSQSTGLKAQAVQ